MSVVLRNPYIYIYAFSNTVGEVHLSNRGKSVIVHSTLEVLAPPETSNGILPDSDGKFCI